MSGPLIVVAAVAGYGVLHSALASPPLKRAARRRLAVNADRFYRLAYNVIAVLSFLPIPALTALLPGKILYRLGYPWWVLSLLGQGAAVGVLLAALWQTDPWSFLGLRPLASRHGTASPRLIIDGLYRWVRHPLYSAALLFVWLTPIMTTSLLALNIALTTYVMLGSMLEERKLLAEFGPEYANYQRRVPRLIPRLGVRLGPGPGKSWP